MSTSTATPSSPVLEALIRELERLARHEEEIAAREAQRVRYWEAMPATVGIHRQCAAALRAAADELLSGAAPGPSTTSPA